MSKLNEEELIKVATKYAYSPDMREDYAFSYSDLVAFAREIEEMTERRLITLAVVEKNRLGEMYQKNIKDNCADMNSNGDWRKLEGAVSVIEAMGRQESAAGGGGCWVETYAP